MMRRNARDRASFRSPEDQRVAQKVYDEAYRRVSQTVDELQEKYVEGGYCSMKLFNRVMRDVLIDQGFGPY